MRWRWGAGRIGLLGFVLLSACDAGNGPSTPSPPARGSRSIGCRAGVALDALDGVRREIQVGQEMRSYLLDVPAGPADTPRPVVVALHGFRATPGNLRTGTGLAQMGTDAGMIVAFPEGHDGVRLLGVTGRGWDVEVGATRDVAFIMALLDTLEHDWCVDPRREFVTGMSNGAMFASVLGCVSNDRLAGLGLVAGAMALPACPTPRPLPVLLIHGGADDVIPPDVARRARNWWAQTNGCASDTRQDASCRTALGCRAPVTYCETNEGHTWPGFATRRVLDFFAAQAQAAPG